MRFRFSALRLLNLSCAAQRVDDAGELHEQPVAGGLDDPTTVLGDLGIDQLAAMGLQPRKRPFLVGTDQPAIARDVRGENGGPPAFDAFGGQRGASNRGAEEIIGSSADFNGKRQP